MLFLSGGSHLESSPTAQMPESINEKAYHEAAARPYRLLLERERPARREEPTEDPQRNCRDERISRRDSDRQEAVCVEICQRVRSYVLGKLWTSVVFILPALNSP